MQSFKKYISMFLICTVFIFSVSTAYYTVPTKADFIFDFFEWSVEALREVGLIYDPSLHPKSLSEVAEQINDQDPSAEVEPTNESIGTYITNNTVINDDHSKTYNSKVNNFLQWYGDSCLEQNKMYQGFSVDLQYYSNIWNLQNVVEQYQDDYYCFMAFGGNPISVGLLVCIPQGKESFVYSSSVGTEKYKVSIYDTLTFNSPNMSDVKVFDLKSTGPV